MKAKLDLAFVCACAKNTLQDKNSLKVLSLQNIGAKIEVERAKNVELRLFWCRGKHEMSYPHSQRPAKLNFKRCWIRAKTKQKARPVRKAKWRVSKIELKIEHEKKILNRSEKKAVLWERFDFFVQVLMPEKVNWNVRASDCIPCPSSSKATI